MTARDGSFQPTVEEIAEAVGPYTKAIILNSPNNPSGVVYSDEFVAGVVELCEKRNLYLIMDDTYNRLIFDGRTPTNCYRFSQGSQPRQLQAGGHQLRFEDVRHDGLPHRLGGRQQGARPRHGQHPVAGDLRAGGAVAVGRGGRAQRRAVVRSRACASRWKTTAT